MTLSGGVFVLNYLQYQDFIYSWESQKVSPETFKSYRKNT